MTPANMRFTFLTAAAGVAAVSVGFALYFNNLRCAAPTASADCNAFTLGSVKNGELYLLVGLPLTIIIPLLALAWLMGRTPPPRPTRQHNDT
ncbi:hypothetical protein LZG00_10170 [Rhodobacteraceae bacterium LMO-12]|nr:hypothetical protein [Rhodobacteraceae bacterium LMO-JJ12]